MSYIHTHIHTYSSKEEEADAVRHGILCRLLESYVGTDKMVSESIHVHISAMHVSIYLSIPPCMDCLITFLFDDDDDDDDDHVVGSYEWMEVCDTRHC